MRYRIVLSPNTASLLKRLGALAVWLFGGAALVLSVFVFSFYMAMKVEMRSTEVVVPDLIGLQLDDATKAVDPLALRLEVVDQRHDPAVASGRILQQQPPSGSLVRRGRKLKLVLSLGGKILTVPNLLGKADRAVAIELRQDGFAPGDQARVFSYDVPAGKVLAQVPPAGSPGVPNTRVHRLVSDGPPVRGWVMPDLTGLSRRTAEEWIKLCGFRRGPVRKIASRGQPAGTVVGQLPLAGYRVSSSDIVELTVAR